MHHSFCARPGQVVSILGAGAALALALAVTLLASDGDARADDFVRARGRQLVVGDAPFRFVGANLAVMHNPDNRAAAENLIAEAARDGVRVGRVWALGEGPADAPSWLRENFLFRAGSDGWIEGAARQLDRVIAAAGRAGIRLIITLSNNWSDYGGVPQYLRWAGRWSETVYGAADAFYSDPRARSAFRVHVERLLRRTNTVTGLRYRDDPTIMAWELMNESQVATAAGAAARRGWIVEMARLIHDLDPNHLVTPGVSNYRLERERREWLAICRLPEVDVCDGHIYPEDMLANREAVAIDAMIDDFVQLAEFVAGKPFVLGEFGVHGDATGTWRGQSRAAWIARVFDRLRYDGAAGGLVWIYQPTAGGLTAAAAATGHDIGVRDPRAGAIRQAMRDAAAFVLAGGQGDPPNPLLGRDKGDAPLLPLRAELEGAHPVVPIASLVYTGSAPSLRASWDPPTYERASWEASGVYAGGAVEHAWGTETGYYEYGYEIPARPAPGAPRAARALALRARVSSEFPGALSPPDGASRFEASLDGLPIAAGVAVRDDGLGRWVTLRSSSPALLRVAASPGHHRLRLTVPPGPRAHGLCVYGRPGDKPIPRVSVTTGPISLTLALAGGATAPRP